jgi:hypothetical protein
LTARVSELDAVVFGIFVDVDVIVFVPAVITWVVAQVFPTRHTDG